MSAHRESSQLQAQSSTCTPGALQAASSDRRYRNALLILLLLTTAVRLLYVNMLGLAPDEAYYWDLSRRLQLSYFDHPPLWMYLIRLSAEVFGDTAFAIRFPCIVIGGAITLLAYLVGKALFDGRVGFYSSLLINIAPIYAVFDILSTVDTPLALFWLCALYFAVKALTTGDGRWWYLDGAALGLGFLSKYTMILFVPALLIFILLCKEHRYWLKKKEVYLGLGVALIFSMPVILWNFQNDWISFRFQFSRGFGGRASAGLFPVARYLLRQAMVVSPLLFLACVWAMMHGLIVWGRNRSWQYLFLTCTSAFVLLFFGCASPWAKLQAGNWPAIGYFSAIVCLVSAYFGSNYSRKRVLAALVVGTTFIAALLFHIHVARPVISLRHDPTDQFHGWVKLGRETGNAVKEFRRGADPFILTESYQLAAELTFHTPSQPRVYEFPAMGRFNQYNMWEGPKSGQDAILVTETWMKDAYYYPYLFDDVKEIKQVTRSVRGKTITTYTLLGCRNFKGYREEK